MGHSTPTASSAHSPASGEERYEQLDAMLGGLWERFREPSLSRLTRLEDAARALAQEHLSAESRRQAQEEAHRLAGSLGSFGFPEGSRLAREIELLLAGSAPLHSSPAERLHSLTEALREVLSRPPQAPAPEEKQRQLLLIIEPNATFAGQVQEEASSRGLEVLRAATLSEAHAALAVEGPGAVLLDPGIAGSWDAGMRLLDEMTTRAPGRPVLVTSPTNEFSHRVTAARFGAHAFLPQPIAPSQVAELAQQALSGKQVTGRVLVVDDDPVILALLRSLLRPLGVEVTTLSDPREFWDVLEAARPELVILDVEMPHVNGIDLCRVLRNDARWSTTPVLFLTAHHESSTINEVFAAGADDFVTKPFVGPELITRITNRLERSRLYRQIADTDALTGVSNRRKSEESLTLFLSLAARESRALSFAVLDLDHFKGINDRFGHAVGDDVLRRVAKRLRTSLRGEDVVGRWGGEEFVVGLFGATKQVLNARLTRILSSLQAEGMQVGSEHLPLTFSAGVAEYPADGADLPALYRAADAALYEAKSQGRARVLSAGGTSRARTADSRAYTLAEVLQGAAVHA